MTHYKMLDRAPSVVITSNRNELKLYQDNTVFLNDGDNFELRFFNPLPEKIGVQINFNGINKGDGYLVLNPGQDIILDRFLDEQRKMLFETYVVNGNNEAAVKAIEENGVISFNFFKERHSYRTYNEEVNIKYSFPPKPPKPYKNKGMAWGSGTSGYSGSSGTSGTSGTSGSSGVSGIQGCAGPAGFSGSGGGAGLPHFTNINTTINTTGGGTTTSSTYTTNTTNTYSNYLNSNLESSIAWSEYLCENTDKSIDYNDYINSSFSEFDVINKNSRTYDPLETGRIEKGDTSRQTLKGVNLQFADLPFHSMTYKIMPISTMNRTIKEVREYCTHCGYRIRKNTWEFCPKCGSHLI